VHHIDVGETFFFAIALYDVEKRLKLSETWHTDINDTEALRALSDTGSTICPQHRYRTIIIIIIIVGKTWHNETRAASALFDVGGVAAAARDVVLVVRIERVAVADDAAGTELYAKAELKPKEASKARQEVTDTHKKLGQTLQVS
jgi:hypothetical protein